MSVYIGIPSYDGKLHWKTCAGLMQTARYLGEAHISIGCEIIPHDAFVGRARNMIAHKFLKSGFRDLVFVDADIGFQVEDLAKLCKAAPDIVMGMYLMKTEKPRYPALMCDPLVRHPTDMRLVKIKYGPAGFMRIRRNALEKMIEKWPEEYYIDGAHGKIYDLFPHGRYGHRFTGEDIKFCERAEECGLDIWAMQGISLQHFGEKSWDSTWQIDAMSIHNGVESPSAMGAPDGYQLEKAA